MKAIVTCEGTRWDGLEIEGGSLREIQRKLGGYLEVGGPRGLRAWTDDGQEIVSSLYPGEDYIKDRRGRIIR